MRGRQLARRGSQRRRALRSIVTFLVTAINAELAERAEKRFFVLQVLRFLH